MLRRALLILAAVAVVVGSGLAGVWFARSPARLGRSSPLTLSAIVGADAIVVQAGTTGKVRLVAVKEGDMVQAGQLIAWLEAPELRESVRAAEDAVRDAQRRLDALRSGRPSRERLKLARAEAEATAAQRALEQAEELSRQVPDLTERVATARRALDEATLQLASAEADANQGNVVSPSTADTGGGVALESSGDGENTGESAVETPAANPVPDFVREARRRKEAAARALARAEEQLRRAERAARQLAALADGVSSTAVAVDEARKELSERIAAEGRGGSEEERLRREVREAQAIAAQARARLREAVVVAAAGGLVEHVAVSAGQELAEGEAIATLRQLNPVWAEVTLAPNAVNRVHRKQKVTLSIPSSERIAAVGEIASMAPRSTHRESPWTVKVVFPNPQHQLLPGAEVQLTFR